MKKVEVGMKLAGRYLVEKELGAGTMAYVVLARDTRTNERVACKIPLDASDYRTKGLSSQYNLFRKLKLSALPALHSKEVHEGPDGPIEFLVFEFVEGVDIATWSRGRSLRERLGTLIAIGETLHALSEAGVTHGDLWSGNVLVQSSGRVVLIDPDAERFGSSRLQTIVEKRSAHADLAGLRSMVEELLDGAGDAEVRGAVLQRLATKGLEGTFGRDLAMAIRSLLSLPFLPGERDLKSLADEYTVRVEQDRILFTKICTARDSVFRNTRTVLARLMTTFQITPQLPIPENAEDEPLGQEIASAAVHRGILQPRVFVGVSPNGDRIGLFFDGQTDIRKPWPDPNRQGLVATGWLNVTRDGKAILSQRLELWLRDDTPTLFVLETGRHRLLNDEAIERSLRVLIERVIPGFEKPSVPTARPQIGRLWRQYAPFVSRWCQQKKVPAPSIGMKEWWWKLVEMLLSGDVHLGGHLRHEAALRKFFQIPPNFESRLTLVRAAGQQLASAIGADLGNLYQLDVEVLDEADGLLRITFDSKEVFHSFDVDLATTQMRLARASRGSTTVAKTQTKPSRAPKTAAETEADLKRALGLKNQKRREAESKVVKTTAKPTKETTKSKRRA